VRDHAWLAAALAIITSVVGCVWSTRVAAGSDAYGYVSQVDLWLRGDLHIDQDFVKAVPWPMARWTFAPLGYRPEPNGFRIVPAYAPGLPWLMAVARTIAGQCAMFWVVPIMGGILVFATYWIGRRLDRPVVGLAAAWIVATSPAMLFMLMPPMSDVPAAAAWAVAVALALSETPRGALGAGAAAAIAILVRPNLAPLAGVLALWLAWRDADAGRWRDARRVAWPWFVVAAGTGVIAVAILNERLYGSPIRSGYELNNAFLVANVWPNVRRYLRSFVSAEPALGMVGFPCLALPLWSVWRSPRSRTVWPLLAALHHAQSRWWRRTAVTLAVTIGVGGVVQAVSRGAFAEAAGEAKYIEVAKAVETLTSPDDVIIALQHGGSLRYYAGRLTLRWDVVDPEWLDRTIAWLDAHGHHPYFVLEEPEIATLRAKLGSTNTSARLDWTPLVSFRGGAIKLYDAVRRDASGTPVVQRATPRTGECLPARPPPRPWS
jgi:hypothetical protein